MQERCLQWWSDYGDAVLGWAVWLFLIVGLPMLVSMCNGKKSSPAPKSPYGHAVAQYTVTYYADGAQEWEEVTDDL